jgi:hypothetical protein
MLLEGIRDACRRSTKYRTVTGIWSGRGRSIEGIVSMLWILAIVLLILWATGWLAFHVAGGLIHLLLVIALIVLVVQLFTGRRAL